MCLDVPLSTISPQFGSCARGGWGIASDEFEIVYAHSVECLGSH